MDKGHIGGIWPGTKSTSWCVGRERGLLLVTPLEREWLVSVALCFRHSTKTNGCKKEVIHTWIVDKITPKILRIQFKLNTALLSTVRVSVRSCVTGVTSHISHIYKGINAMLIIKPYIFWIKIILAIFLAKTRPDKTIFSALTNMTSDHWFWL